MQGVGTGEGLLLQQPPATALCSKQSLSFSLGSNPGWAASYSQE